MSNPTPAQIKIATINLSNMKSLNDPNLYGHAQERINHAFQAFSATDTNDPGLNAMIDILEAAFSGFGSEFGAIGSFASTLLNGMLSFWAGNPPPSLNGQFASYFDCYEKTTNAITKQLDAYINGINSTDAKTVEETWNTKLTFNGKTTTVGDLASSDFPAPSGPTEPQFDAMVQKAAVAFDQRLWKQLLINNYHVDLLDGNVDTGYKDQHTPPIKWVQDQIEYYKYSYYTWSWFDDRGGANCSRWIALMYGIRTGHTYNYGYVLNDECCQYLFIDSTPGTTINPDGLYTRQEVVDFLGIRYAPPVTTLSESYMKAARRGKSFERLVETQGREAIESRVIQKAQEDAVFARNLVLMPKPTLEEFFDIKIPDHITLTVVVEDEMHYGLVIRGAKGTEE